MIATNKKLSLKSEILQWIDGCPNRTQTVSLLAQGHTKYTIKKATGRSLTAINNELNSLSGWIAACKDCFVFHVNLKRELSKLFVDGVIR